MQLPLHRVKYPPHHLRIAFFGTPDFAEASLRALHDSGHTVVGVVTAPDKKAGRGHKLSTSAVKDAANALNLPIAQPEKLRDPVFLNTLKSWEADIFCVVAFRMLPEVVWSLPPLGTVNVHGSLLPDFRGAAPIQHAVVSGAKRSGVTSFFITREIDTGAILLQRGITIADDDTAGDLYETAMNEGAGLMVDTMDAIASGSIEGIPQSELCSGDERPAPKLFRQDGRIDWHNTDVDVHNFVRGMHPFPGAWTTLNGATFKVHVVQKAPYPAEAPQLSPGQCHSGPNGWWVGTRDRPVLLKTAQLAGKPAMPATDILRGYRYPVVELGTAGK